MKFLKNLSKLLISFSLLTPVDAESLAVVDISRVYEEYSLIEKANTLMMDQEESFKRVLMTAESELKALEEKGESQDVITKREEIQQIVDDNVELLQDIKDEYNLNINRNIQTGIDSIAKNKKFDLVLNKDSTVYSGDDITDELLKYLEALEKQKI